MARLQYVRAQLSDKEKDILNKVINHTITIEDAASQLNVSIQEIKDAVKAYGYSADINKMISYKGTIRQMTLKAKNRKGGTYPLQVVNLYIKPGTERYYDNGVISVDKQKIRTGTEDAGYYPDKAMWSKETYKTSTEGEKPKKQKVSTSLPGIGEGEIPLRRKGKTRIHPKLRKKSRNCACKKKR